MSTKSRRLPIVLVLGAAVFAGVMLGTSSLIQVSGTEATAAAPGSAEIELAGPPEEPADLERAPDPVAREHERARLDPHDPRFTPTAEACALGGWIERDGGGPVRGAHLAAFAAVPGASDQGGAPLMPALAESACDDRGVVYAKVPHDGEIVVVAFAPGFEPATRVVRARPGERVELEPFHLRTGAAIRGRVTAGGKPLACAEVQADLSRATDVATLDGGKLAWRSEGPGEPGGAARGGFEWARALARTGPDGSYSIRGLGPALQRVRLSAIRCSEVALDSSRARMREVQAPAENVDFLLEAARLDIEVRSQEGAVAGADVQIEAGDTHWTRKADDAGRVTLAVSPAGGYVIVARSPGFTPSRQIARGLADGENAGYTLDLEPVAVRDRATLVVVDRGRAGGSVAMFQIWPRSANPVPYASPGFDRYVERTGGEFRVPDVPPGEWRVTMFSGERVDADVNRVGHMPIWTNCQLAFDVSIPATGEVRKEVDPQKRGALRLSVRNPQGARVEAFLDVTDVRDQKLDFEIDRSSRSVDPKSPVVVYTAACSGPVRLVISRSESQTRTLDAEIVPALTTDLEVVLQPK